MLQAGMLAIVCELATIIFCLTTHCLIYGIVKALQTKPLPSINQAIFQWSLHLALSSYIASMEVSYHPNFAMHNMCCIESDIYRVSTSVNHRCYKQLLQYLIIHHSFNILHVRPYNTVHTGPLAI